MTRQHPTPPQQIDSMRLHKTRRRDFSFLVLSLFLVASQTSAFQHPRRAEQTPACYSALSMAKKRSETEGGVVVTSTASVMPNRTRKKMHKRQKSGKSMPPAPRKSKNEVLTEEDLADHVSNIYLQGGFLRKSGEEDQRAPQKQQQRHLANLDRRPALVLNADYQPLSRLPLSIWHWQEAIKAIFSGKVTVVDVYPDVSIRAAHLEIPLPSVIALNEYVPPQYHHTPAFTKRNVFLRDEYRCQYCNDRFHTRDLSLDHVHPRCMGGRLEWENAVTCCKNCNGRKGSLAVSQLRQVGMKLLRDPHVPSQFELANIAGRMLPQKVHPTWEPYLPIQAKKGARGSTSASASGGGAGHQQQEALYMDEAL